MDFNPLGFVCVWLAARIVPLLGKTWVRIFLGILFFSLICIFALLVGQKEPGPPSHAESVGIPWSTILFWSAFAAPFGYGFILYWRGRRLLSASADSSAVYDFRSPVEVDGKVFPSARITLYESNIVIATAFRKIKIPLNAIRSVDTPVKFPVTVLHIHPLDQEMHPFVDLKCTHNSEFFKILASMLKNPAE